MNTLLVESLCQKLRKRVSRFGCADEPDTFRGKLAQFWQFFDRQDMFLGIMEDLLARFPCIDDVVKCIYEGKFNKWPETEEETAAIGYCVLRRLVDQPDQDIQKLSPAVGALLHRPPVTPGILDLSTQGVLELFFHPFCDYVDEQLDDQRIMLALLRRYKHRSEWFNREELRNLAAKTRVAEKCLALDLYRYLYDQGIDFHLEPSSMSGKIDLIAAQNTDDPLLLDAKVLDDKRGKSYIRKAFNQIYDYTQKYNEPFGYLAIYQTTSRELVFSLKLLDRTPVVIYNHKTIFLLTIDVSPWDQPPSERPLPERVEITENDLLGG